MEFRHFPHINSPVDFSNNEICTRELEKMVEAMKGAVAMDIRLFGRSHCAVSLYCPNGDCVTDRRQLSAITMSSEQSRTRATDGSVWLGIEPYEALFNHGTTRDFIFCLAGGLRHGALHTFVRKLGLSIAQNANLVECLRIGARYADRCGFFNQLFSLDVWKKAFPALQLHT